MTRAEALYFAEYLFRLDDEQERLKTVMAIAQAARADALEAAAKVAENEKRDPEVIWYMGNVRYGRMNDVLDRIAQAIRQLKSTSPPQS